MTDQPSNRPMRQLLAEAEKGLAASDGSLAAQLKGTTRELNAASPPRHHNEGLPRFVDLADKLYDAAIESAKRQVNRAENLLKQIEQEADDTRQRVRAKWHEIQELERNLEDMSSELLQTFGRHNGSE
jgi:chromosome segregation ATPase